MTTSASTDDPLGPVRQRVAQLLTLALDRGSTDGEVVNAMRLLAKNLAGAGVDKHTIIERLQAPPVTEADMAVVYEAGFDAGRAKANADAQALQQTIAGASASLGIPAAGDLNGYSWREISDFCLRNVHRIDNPWEAKFVRSVAEGLKTYSKPTAKQQPYSTRHLQPMVQRGHHMNTAVTRFLEAKAKAPPRQMTSGRLVFSLDATASRMETWDLAASLQHKMFEEVTAIGALEVQLAYFRGPDEFKATSWTTDPMALARSMAGITCRAGETQIRRLLGHVVGEASERPIAAVVFVGDAFEEPVPHEAAEKLRALGTRLFLFQEGIDEEATVAFRTLARITGGVHGRFDQGSAKQLGELLRAVAAFAVGGVAALQNQGSDAAKLLLGQIR